MLKIAMSVKGTSLPDQAKSARDDLARIVTIAVTGATEGAKETMRRQLRAGGGQFGRFANAIQSRVYPKSPRFSVGAAGSVFAAGDAADKAFSAFATGAIVTPTRARALAIPLHGFRGADGRLLGPKSSFFVGRLFFVPRARRDRSLVIGVLATPTTGRPGQVRKTRGTKKRAGISAGISDFWTPQFVLVRSAKLPKLLSPEAVIDEWMGKIPALAEQAMALVLT